MLESEIHDSSFLTHLIKHFLLPGNIKEEYNSLQLEKHRLGPMYLHSFLTSLHLLNRFYVFT